ncbi:hypothetical protein [Streptomyces sp. NPDC057682]|uniref:hypothetical protein n=1 Tax=Streptomyces sp. NPDC057682 TaxID=3346210 RepID=UPI0036CA0CAE
MIKELVGQLGQPTAYSGGPGLSVRWRTELHTATLETGDGYHVQLSVRRNLGLKEHKWSWPRPGSLKNEALPYLWRYQPCGRTLPEPAARLAQNWVELEEALATLLRSWCQHLELLFGDRDAGFTIDHGDGQLILMVDPGTGIEDPGDGVAVFADKRDGTDRNSRQLRAMTARGWHSYIPVLSYWEAYFDRGRDGSEAAARLVVEELRARGVSGPDALRLIRPSVGSKGGWLDVPGAGIAPGAPQ